MIVKITLNSIGADVSTIRIYSNSDNYLNLVTTATRLELLNGINVSMNKATTSVKLKSDGVCNNEVILNLDNTTTTTNTTTSSTTTSSTTSTTSTSSTTTSTTTSAPVYAPVFNNPVYQDNATESTISISWLAATPGTNAISFYRIRVNGNIVGTTLNLNYTIKGLTIGTTYSVIVEAIDTIGLVGASTSLNFSTVTTTTTSTSTSTTSTSTTTTSAAASLAQVTQLSLYSNTETSLTFQWGNVAGATGYKVYLGGVLWQTFIGNSQDYTVDVYCGSSWTVTVSAINSVTEGLKSAPLGVSTLDCTLRED